MSGESSVTQERGWGKGTSANPPLPAFVSVSRIVSQALGAMGLPSAYAKPIA